MKQTFTLVSILCMLPFVLLAQTNFRKAKAVTISGDTLEGYVNLREWNINPKSFELKQAEDNANAISLTPQNISFVAIEDLEVYKRFAGPVSMNYLEVAKLPVGPKMPSQPDTIFIRQLYKGKNVTLYTYTDHIKTRYFAETMASGMMQELYFAKYFAYQQAKEIKYVHQYRGQLWGIAIAVGTTSATLQHQIEKADYTEAELIRIARLMNGTEETDKALRTDSRKKYGWYAGVGMNRSTAKVRDNDPLISDAHKSVSYSPSALVGVISYFNKNTRRLGVRLEAGYAFANHNADATYRKEGLISYIVRTFQQQYHNFSLSPQLHYNLYNGNQWKFLLNGGFSINYAQATSNSLLNEHYYYNDKMEKEMISSSDVDFSYNKLWFGIPVRVGATMAEKYEFALSYHVSIRPGIQEQVSYSCLQLGVNYHFKR